MKRERERERVWRFLKYKCDCLLHLLLCLRLFFVWSSNKASGVLIFSSNIFSLSCLFFVLGNYFKLLGILWFWEIRLMKVSDNGFCKGPHLFFWLLILELKGREETFFKVNFLLHSWYLKWEREIERFEDQAIIDFPGFAFLRERKKKGTKFLVSES